MSSETSTILKAWITKFTCKVISGSDSFCSCNFIGITHILTIKYFFNSSFSSNQLIQICSFFSCIVCRQINFFSWISNYIIVFFGSSSPTSCFTPFSSSLCCFLQYSLTKTILLMPSRFFQAPPHKLHLQIGEDAWPELMFISSKLLALYKLLLLLQFWIRQHHPN